MWCPCKPSLQCPMRGQESGAADRARRPQHHLGSDFGRGRSPSFRLGRSVARGSVSQPERCAAVAGPVRLWDGQTRGRLVRFWLWITPHKWAGRPHKSHTVDPPRLRGQPRGRRSAYPDTRHLGPSGTTPWSCKRCPTTDGMSDGWVTLAAWSQRLLQEPGARSCNNNCAGPAKRGTTSPMCNEPPFGWRGLRFVLGCG